MVNVLKVITIIIYVKQIKQGDDFRMARPKKEVVKEKTLQARVSLEEYAHYNELAEEMGMNVSTLIRAALISYCKDKK